MNLILSLLEDSISHFHEELILKIIRRKEIFNFHIQLSLILFKHNK